MTFAEAFPHLAQHEAEYLNPPASDDWRLLRVMDAMAARIASLEALVCPQKVLDAYPPVPPEEEKSPA